MIDALYNTDTRSITIATDDPFAAIAQSLTFHQDGALFLNIAPGVSKPLILANDPAINIFEDIETARIVLMKGAVISRVQTLNIRKQ